eukprot:c26476_g1_i1 orf=241-2415(-)
MGFPGINSSICIHTDSNSIAKNIEIQDRPGSSEFGEDISPPLELIPMACHICLATNSASAGRCPGRLDQRTVDDLRVFLQDMTRTIRSLVDRDNSICENDKVCATDCVNVETSMSLAMPSISLRKPLTLEVQSTQWYHGETVNVQGTFQPDRRVGNSRQATTGFCNQETKLPQTQDWICEDWPQEGQTQQESEDGFKKDNGKTLNSRMFEAHLSTGRSFSEEESQGHRFDANAIDTLRGFLEEMKNTIETWSNRFKLLIENHFISSRENAESIVGPLLSSELPAIAFGEPHLQLSFQDMDVDQVQGETTMVQSDHPDHEGTHINQVAHSDHMATESAPMWRNRIQECDHEEANVELPQPNDFHGDMSQLSQLDRLAKSNEGEKELPFLSPGRSNAREVVVQSSQVDHSEVIPMTQLDRRDLDGQFTHKLDTRNVDVFLPQMNQEHISVESAGRARDEEIQGTDNGESSNCIVELKAGSGNISEEKPVTAKHQKHEVQVVQSPDWLPEGWMTEIKIRVSGNSAGARDKYFFDPVTKRRFRSKKEVFCFLETGTLGRYKPRSRNKVDEEKAGRRLSSIVRKRKGRLATQSAGVPTKPLSLPSVSAPISSVSAPGISSSVLLPSRSGQPVEWVAYESFSSLPIPVFEHFPYLDKDSATVNGSKASSHGQWVFSNADPAWRPHPQRKDKCKAVDGSKDPTNLGCAGEGIDPSEKIVKHSAVGTRKIST